MNKWVDIYPSFSVFKTKLNSFKPNLVDDTDGIFFIFLSAVFKMKTLLSAENSITNANVFKQFNQFKLSYIKILKEQEKSIVELITSSSESLSKSSDEALTEENAKMFISSGGSNLIKPSVLATIQSVVSLPNIYDLLEKKMSSVFSGVSSVSPKSPSFYKLGDEAVIFDALAKGADELIKNKLDNYDWTTKLDSELTKLLLSDPAKYKGQKGDDGTDGVDGAKGADGNLKTFEINSKVQGVYLNPQKTLSIQYYKVATNSQERDIEFFIHWGRKNAAGEFQNKTEYIQITPGNDPTLDMKIELVAPTTVVNKLRKLQVEVPDINEVKALISQAGVGLTVVEKTKLAKDLQSKKEIEDLLEQTEHHLLDKVQDDLLGEHIDYSQHFEFMHIGLGTVMSQNNIDAFFTTGKRSLTIDFSKAFNKDSSGAKSSEYLDNTKIKIEIKYYWEHLSNSVRNLNTLELSTTNFVINDYTYKSTWEGSTNGSNTGTNSSKVADLGFKVNFLPEIKFEIDLTCIKSRKYGTHSVATEFYCKTKHLGNFFIMKAFSLKKNQANPVLAFSIDGDGGVPLDRLPWPFHIYVKISRRTHH